MYKEKRERQVQKAFEILADDLPADLRCVAQWGGGDGLQCESLARRGYFCVSLDISLEMLKMGLQYAAELGYAPNMGFVAATAERPIPLKDRVFDVNMAFSCLNHIHPQSWDIYLSERKRVTKPGGLLFDVVPNIGNRRLYDSETFRALKKPGREQEFLEHVGQERVSELYKKHGLRGVRDQAYDRVPDELLLVSLPEVLLKRTLGIRSRRYPNWLYSKLFRTLARLDDAGVPLPGVLWSRPKWMLVAGVVAA